MVGARLANLSHGQKKADTEILVSQTEASSMVKVSPDSISFAKKVQSQGVPEFQTG